MQTDTQIDRPNSLADAIDQACGLERVPPAPPPRKRQWRNTGGLQWVGPFGTFLVQGDNCHIDRHSQFTNTCSWAAIHFNGQPDSLTFRLDITSLEDGVQVLHLSRGGEEGKVVTRSNVTDKEIPSLEVKVRWSDGKPNVRQPEGSSICFVFLTPEGMFVQLEVAVVTRAHRCWLSIQEINNGQNVRTTREIAETLGITTYAVGPHAVFVAPFDSTNAYPGNDYLKRFPGAFNLLKYCLKEGAVMPLHRCHLHNWEPETKTLTPAVRREGWQTAVVLWFNAEHGCGEAECEDGTRCYIYFKSIVDRNESPIWCRGGFPFVDPMTTVAIKHRPDPKRGRSATAVLVLE